MSVFGASASLILVYSFPPLVKMMDHYLKKKGININSKNDDNDYENMNNKEIKDIKIKNNWKDILFYSVNILLILLGVFTVVLSSSSSSPRN